MSYIFEQPVPGTPDRLVVKRAAWNHTVHSVKYVWPDKNGNPARGGEIPITSVRQMVRFLAEVDEISPAERAGIINDLARSLVKRRVTIVE